MVVELLDRPGREGDRALADQGEHAQQGATGQLNTGSFGPQGSLEPWQATDQEFQEGVGPAPFKENRGDVEVPKLSGLRLTSVRVRCWRFCSFSQEVSSADMRNTLRVLRLCSVGCR
eukprot:8062221-Lingulodinium_polyedra.AAC.1